MNTKNLKNFFAERLPQKDADIFKINFTIEPSRMFDIKRKQNELKSETTIVLDKTIDTEDFTNTIEPRKIMESFLVKDKNL